MRYSQELREIVLRRVLPPKSESISLVAKEEGISVQTVLNWRNKALGEGFAPKTEEQDPWDTRDKFHIVLETAGMAEAELAEYARQKGIFIEQIQDWRDACMNANGGMAKEAAKLNKALKESEKKARQMEKELIRKEKALAEAAALMLLQKKVNAIWGTPEGD